MPKSPLKSYILGFLCPRRFSMTTHPQLLVCPFRRLLLCTFVIFPQSHLHNHMTLCLPDGSILSTVLFKTVSFPNLCPVKSINFPISSPPRLLLETHLTFVSFPVTSYLTDTACCLDTSRMNHDNGRFYRLTSPPYRDV